MQRREFMASVPLVLAGAVPGAGEAKAGMQETQAAVEGKKRVLAVSAHPADFCSRAGGTLIECVRAGCAVKVIWLSHGETDESQLLYKKQPGILIEEVRRVREREAFAAVQAVGAEGRMLGFGDNPLHMTAERIEILAKEIAGFKPDLVLTHWKEERTYPSHWITAQSVIQAAQIAHVPWDIRFFEATIGTAGRVGFVPDYYVDITDAFDKKIEALKKLETQPQLVEYYTTCARWRGLECGRRYAEGFVRWAPKTTVQSPAG